MLLYLQVRLDSGDMILFNGQKLFHSVDQILPDTCPMFWMDGTVDTMGYARFNLQFRDSTTAAKPSGDVFLCGGYPHSSNHPFQATSPV